MRKSKLPHPVLGLLQMVIGILTPMEEGDRDFAKHEFMKMQKKTSTPPRPRAQGTRH